MFEPPSSPKFALHRQLIKLLRLREMSYKELSRRAGVPIKTLYRWSYGEPPSKGLASIYRVAEVLGVTMEELVFFSKNSSSEISLPMERHSLESLNMELKAILHDGLKGKVEGSGVSDLILITLMNPIAVPCYILFGTAKELGRVEEICNLLSKFGYFGRTRHTI